MGIRFRQKIKTLPGVHINVTGKGITSLSIGAPGSTFNINRDLTVKNTISIPGSGLSYRHTIYKNNKQITVQGRHFENDSGHDFSHPEEKSSPRLLNYYVADWCQPDLQEVAEHLIENHKRLALLIAERSNLAEDIKSKNRFTLIDRLIKMFNKDKWNEIQRWRIQARSATRDND